MELRHLRYFVAVAEEENVTRAAAKLHVSQPALSRQVRDLEGELGLSLLERSAKTVRLTEAGRVFLTEARAVLERADRAVKNVHAVSGGLHGEINVGYAPSLTVQILPQALRVFQAKFPGVRVSLHDLSTEQMLTGLRQGSLQVALMVRPQGGKIRDLKFQELARYPIMVAVAPKHRLGSRKSIDLKQIAAEGLIGYSEADYPEYHRMLDVLFAPVGRKPRIVEQHDSVTSLIAAVEASTGVALVPSCVACMVGPRLTLLPIKPAPPPVIVFAAHHEGSLSAATENFIAAALKK